MSLTSQQQLATSDELRRNAELTGMSMPDLAHRVGWSDARLERTLAVVGSSPADVWVLRDVLVQAVRAAGREPVPFTVLTEDKRRSAGLWFGVSQEMPGVG